MAEFPKFKAQCPGCGTEHMTSVGGRCEKCAKAAAEAFWALWDEVSGR
jgi:tRNA(Ile2) C34 agmatinyltransferase TiaS